jgi:hypothetical protein
MTLPNVIAIVLAVVSMAGCTGQAPEPASSRPEMPRPTPSAAALTYRYSALDLCALTDLGPLAALKLTVQEKRRAAPSGRKGEAEACLYEMGTQSGDIARLSVEAVPAKSLDEAQIIYGAAEHNSMKPDGQITGLGEQAEGRTLDTELGYRHSEYMIHLRSQNLHLAVWLAVGGASFTPKETLAPKVKAISEATFAAVARAWQ